MYIATYFNYPDTIYSRQAGDGYRYDVYIPSLDYASQGYLESINEQISFPQTSNNEIVLLTVYSEYTSERVEHSLTAEEITAYDNYDTPLEVDFYNF